MAETDGTISGFCKIEDMLRVLDSEIAVSKEKRSLPDLALLMIDIDNLERINRWYGRSLGNEVLDFIGGLLASALNEDGFLARFGGDEFLILMRGTTFSEAKDKAREIIAVVKNNKFNAKKIKISVSIGIANYFSFAFSSDEFIGCVVEALTLAQKEAASFKVFMEEEEWNESR
ncbi:MAG: GGDEF domain-containing protein [Candidatus Omnitrophota bacterium]